MLVDNVTITVRAGNGGNGAATFRKDGRTAKGGPDGGNGGNGGNVYVQGTTNANDLREFRYKKKIVAENGVNGMRKNLFGRNGADETVVLPVGTRLTDTATGKILEITDTTRRFRIARGGKGGRGNREFRSATNQTPRYAEPGTAGEERRLLLELRLIAEIGLIGLPNAGKSSLLAVLTNATPAVGDYPFTTLEPNIGMLGRHPIADIPGLIEGASTGKGLGTKFLKHIEKTKILVHCIALTDTDPLASYRTVREEFRQYNQALLGKPEIVLLSKTDLVSPETAGDAVSLFTAAGLTTTTYSVSDPESIDRLKRILNDKLEGPTPSQPAVTPSKA
jgi:GTP-binding protein